MIRVCARGRTPGSSGTLLDRPSGPLAAPFQGMKMFLLIVLSVTALFIWQRHGGSDAAPESKPATATAAASATPRPVYEHDWAKHSLDRAQEVANQVRETRKQNEQP